ncbi:LysM peptidoglycan-binding domain-containing protein, partial [Hydrogenivirga sp. 128-5-R1-1]|uniref:LysM peptidoglycan-binding domain-containing protein n=1 Tax=Hydrogenivirga sp. 128-5-R1-1 TaxID=392423 RepID=UPI00015EF1A7
IIYKVKKGDTLGKIAKKFGTTVSSLKHWNKIKSYILPNQKIIIYKRVLNKNLARKAMQHRVNYIRKKVHKRKPKFRYIFYKVKKGDSLIRIAKKFGVSVKQLKKWNNLKSNIIVVNEKLTIIKRVVNR